MRSTLKSFIVSYGNGEVLKDDQILDCARLHLQIKLEIFPLKKSRVPRALHEALERVATKVIEDLLDVRFEEVGWDFILL